MRRRRRRRESDDRVLKADQKIVLVTRETRMAGLRKRYATKSQAAFHVKRAVEAELAREAVAAGAAVVLAELHEAAEGKLRKCEEEGQVYGVAVEQLRRGLEV